MKWVPLLNIVLTVVFYALFPIAFPIFLLPGGGVSALKGYVTGFFYLAAWGPLYVILHMILMLRASSSMTALALASGSQVSGNVGAGVGMTLASSVGIAGVSDDIGVLAGYMVASIPFLAAGIARGALAISGQATSFLAPSQAAAEDAARDVTTGNIALGNTSFDNQSFNNRQGNLWTTAGAYTAGAASLSSVENDGTRDHAISRRDSCRCRTGDLAAAVHAAGVERAAVDLHQERQRIPVARRDAEQQRRGDRVGSDDAGGGFQASGQRGHHSRHLLWC